MEDEDGILGLAVVLDFLSVSVGNSGVGHGVAVVAVAHDLDEEGTVLDGVALSPLEGLPHFKHVVALDSESGNDITTSVEFSIHGGAGNRCAHTVFVVLADEESGKVPQFGHVGSLEDLTLVGSAVAEHDAGHVRLLLVLEGEGQTSSHWHLCAHDTVTAVEIGRFLVVMHRSSLALSSSVALAQHLGDDLSHRVSTFVGLAMDAVCTDEWVVESESGFHALGNGFLSDWWSTCPS